MPGLLRGGTFGPARFIAVAPRVEEKLREARMRSPLQVKRYSFYASVLVVFLVSAGCSRGAPNSPAAGLKSFSADALMKHIRTLSSDQFEGRGPGSKGEELTVKYLEEQFRGIGLRPGNPDGSYVQKVPLVGILPDPRMQLTITGRGARLYSQYQQHCIAFTKRVVEEASIDAEMVFAGYGVQVPEFQWDDFKGMDVKGKVLVVLVNDPPVEDEKIFGGKAMTYYGRWTYKFEKAAELGAAGCLIVHQTGQAGYPWEVVRNSWSAEQFDIESPDKNMNRLALEGWISHETAEKLFRMAGLDLGKLSAAAATRDFQPVPLGLRAKIVIRNRLRTIDSHNVIARLTGSDPKLINSYVIYTAHWDHFGVGPEVNGDRIYLGAVDNASGTAALLETAWSYPHLKTPPRRSILFLSVTAEEQGLL